MPEPTYDFFATGGPVAAPDAAAGTPGAPAHSAPRDPSWAYQPGVVNQFGTPLDVAPAPTGPYAAPGVASGPIAAPGMVSTWGGAPTPTRAAHAAPTRSSDLPRNVRAVAILGLFFGGLLGLATLWAFSQYSQLSDAVGTATRSSQLDSMYTPVLAALVVALVIMAASTVFLLVGAGATLAHRRWGGWMLVVAFGLYLLGQVRQLVGTGFETIPLLTAGIALALFLALVTGEGRQWLLGR